MGFIEKPVGYSVFLSVQQVPLSFLAFHITTVPLSKALIIVLIIMIDAMGMLVTKVLIIDDIAVFLGDDNNNEGNGTKI